MSTVPVYGRWHRLPPAAGVIDEEALSGRVSIFKVHCKNKITRGPLIYPSVNKIMRLPPTNVLLCAAFPALLDSLLEETLVSPRERKYWGYLGNQTIYFPGVCWLDFNYKFLFLFFVVCVLWQVLLVLHCRAGGWNYHFHLILTLLNPVTGCQNQWETKDFLKVSAQEP